MLDAIILKDFKSHHDSLLPLAPLTVLIGANASGKSNAIEGLRILSWLARGKTLNEIAVSASMPGRVVRGQMTDIMRYQSPSFSLGCQMTLPENNDLLLTVTCRNKTLHLSEETLRILNEKIPLYTVKRPSTGESMDVDVAYNNFKCGHRKPLVTCTDQRAIFTQLTSPATFNGCKKTAARIPQIAQKYIRSLSNIFFLDPVPSEMRDYTFPSDNRLQDNGANLSGILFSLLCAEETNEDVRIFNRQDVLEFIQSLPEQNISEISFLEEPRGAKMVQLTETFGGVNREYDASLLSDGTLRVLAVAAAMLSAPSGSLIVLEELDNGIHPSRMRTLLEKIQTVAERRNLKVLLSAHNPAMLDALPPNAIGDTVFCYRAPDDGSSRMVRLCDVENIPELIAQGTLGYLSTTGAIDRFIKNPVSSEQRKQTALDWLAALRQEGSAS